jgi:predicted PurR-regulated permease PerM
MNKQTWKKDLSKPRAVFLLALAVVISLIFFRMIGNFLMSLLLASVLAGMTYPFYSRLLVRLGGRKTIASGLTVLLSLLLVLIPVILFLGIVVGEAVNVSESTQSWVAKQAQQPDSIRAKIAETPVIKDLLPYQDQIIKKVGQLAAKTGTFIANGVAAGAKVTAEFLMMLFVMLFAMFYFLMDGREFLDSVLRYTPLTDDDKVRMLSIYTSVGRATIKGTLVIGIVQGGLAGLSFWVAGIDGAVFWGTLMMVLSIIPGIGTALVWVPAVILLVLEGRIGAAVGVGLWCALVVGTIDNILRPLLVGKDTEMSDLLVLLTTLGGLTLFGPVGILVGPIIGALFKTIWQLWGSAVEESAEIPAEVHAEVKAEE